MNIPASTYRIQFHKDFALRDLKSILTYLDRLGVSTIYASPIFQANPGSMHGYDVADPTFINPEIGTLEELSEISEMIHKNHQLWIQDIVPNHMAYSTNNSRLMDVFEKGPDSLYYHYFDIDWNHKDFPRKVMLPVLSEPEGGITMVADDKGFGLVVNESRYPMSASSIQKMQAAGGNTESLAPELVSEILESQFYKLSNWRDADQQINYRRFFTVNELICLRMEDEKVFEDYHALIETLYKQNIFNALRIDHIDGLARPGEYCQRLRDKFGPGCYIVVEKILAGDEQMPAEWPIQGSSGYEFLAQINQLFTNQRGEVTLKKFYRENINKDAGSYSEIIRKNKTLILEEHMGGEWQNLTDLFMNLRLAGTMKKEEVKKALALLMTSLSVYRIYPTSLPLNETDKGVLTKAFAAAIKASFVDEKLLTAFRDILLLRTDENMLSFLQRLSQFTGPLMAKGVEDTTFYIYNPLISHDEVGETPVAMAHSIQQFHDAMKLRQKNSPLSLNATSTHDTKRGEDGRLRLDVLSEMPDEWTKVIKALLAIDIPAGSKGPVINDRYFIYQSILSGFPTNYRVDPDFTGRLKEYIVKVVREAKQHSKWSDPNESYEEACAIFIERILAHDTFKNIFIPFVEKIDHVAMIYSLAMTLIKITAPGIPDIYQGCELWNHSFVDPDNRRPVDYGERERMLSQIQTLEKNSNSKTLLEWLTANRNAGAQKLFSTYKLLAFRRIHNRVFTEGEYVPLAIKDSSTDIIAYARKLGTDWVIVVTPVSIASSENNVGEAWVELPHDAPREWTSIFTSAKIQGNTLKINILFFEFPVAMLHN